MIPIPSPLHPALVHFPIVLILLGTVVAVASIFLRRWHLPLIAATLLAFGAVGAIAAAWTGGKEEELAGELSARADQVLEQHEEWGERTRNLSIIAALLAIGAVSVGRFPVASRTVSVVAACAALAASYCVAKPAITAVSWFTSTARASTRLRETRSEIQPRRRQGR